MSTHHSIDIDQRCGPLEQPYDPMQLKIAVVALMARSIGSLRAAIGPDSGVKRTQCGYRKADANDRCCRKRLETVAEQ
jgi:hypothetical protein